MHAKASISPLSLLYSTVYDNAVCVHVTPLPSVDLCEYASQPLSLIEEDTRSRLLKLWNRLASNQNGENQVISENDFSVWARLVEQICFDEIENTKTVLQLEREEQIYFDTLKFIELGIISKETILNTLFNDLGNSLTGYHLTLSLYRINQSDSYGSLLVKTLLAIIAPKIKLNPDYFGFIKMTCLNRPANAQTLRRIIDRSPTNKGFCGVPLISPSSIKEMYSGHHPGYCNLPHFSRPGFSDFNLSANRLFSNTEFMGDNPKNRLYNRLTRYVANGTKLVVDSSPFSLLNQPSLLKGYKNLNPNRVITNFASVKHIPPSNFSGSSVTSPNTCLSFISEKAEKPSASQSFEKKTFKRRRVDCRCSTVFCDCCGNSNHDGLFTLSDSEDEEFYNFENPVLISSKTMYQNLKSGKLANGQPSMSRAELRGVLGRDGYDFLKPNFITQIVRMLN